MCIMIHNVMLNMKLKTWVYHNCYHIMSIGTRRKLEVMEVLMFQAAMEEGARGEGSKVGGRNVTC